MIPVNLLSDFAVIKGRIWGRYMTVGGLVFFFSWFFLL
jgi:hypothetical protein